MTTTATTTATTVAAPHDADGGSRRRSMSPLRRTALLVGVLFVITYVTSIAAKFWLYPPLLDHACYIVGGGQDTRVLWGAFAEMILIIADIGTAVALSRSSRGATRGWRSDS